MDSGIFMDMSAAPGEKELRAALGKLYEAFAGLRQYTLAHAPGAAEEWHFSKAGWNLRIKDRKRVIIYLMPCDRYFRSSFVFGKKATEDALEAAVSEKIKETIMAARVYAEGRGFRIDVTGKQMTGDMKKLVAIKLAH